MLTAPMIDDIRHTLAGRDGAVLLISVPAHISHETAEPLVDHVRSHLPNREGAGVVLDLTRVVLISSIGVAALLQIREHCADRAAPLVLASVPESQMVFMRMLKLDRKFEYASSAEDAVIQLDGA